MKNNNKKFWCVLFVLLFFITFSKPVFGANNWFYWVYDENSEVGPFEKTKCEEKFKTVFQNVVVENHLRMSPSCYPKATPGAKPIITNITNPAGTIITEGKFNDHVEIHGTDFTSVTKVFFGLGETTGSLYDSETIGAVIPLTATKGRVSIISSTGEKIESLFAFKINATNNIRWYYRNDVGQLMGPGNSRDTTGFADKPSCETARANYIKGFTSLSIAECKPQTIDDAKKEVADEIARLNNGSKKIVQPVNINSINAFKNGSKKIVQPVNINSINAFKSDYTLLAPINNLKGIVQDDAKNAGCSLNALGQAGVGCYVYIMLMIAIGICGALAVIMIIVYGIMYMGDESVFGKTEAKNRITQALLGLLLALGAYAILYTINPALVGGKLTFNSVDIELEEDSAPILSDEGTAVPTSGDKSCPEGFTSIVTKGQTKFIACKSISSKLKEMIDTAWDKGIKISGGGFRSLADQIALRKANCGGDIYTKPSNQCHPPTARPGRSMHQSGKAFDLKCDGKLINFDGKQTKFAVTPATKTCFDWLKTNAPFYGFHNLKSENWHWSTTGT